MNAQDACRVVVGLIYLRWAARDHHAAVSRRPSWTWLVAQTADRSTPVGPRVRSCLSQWLPRGLGLEDADEDPGLVPRLPATVEDQLRRLIVAIDRAEKPAGLLDQCLADLSAAQAQGGHYFTPGDIVRLMVAAAVPQDGNRVLDPVCGSAGLLIEAVRQVREQIGFLDAKLSLTGQDLHAGTLQIAQMNLAAHGVTATLEPPMDSLERPAHASYDIVLANPPFNVSAWGPDPLPESDPRWPEEAAPPRDKANFAWLLHIAHALAPQGRAAVLMADGAATGVRPIERRIREHLVGSDLVECVVALPPGLFTHTKISCCVWLLNRDKSPHRGWGQRDRRGQVLFIHAREAYELVGKSRQRRLAPDGVEKILRTLAAWRGTAADSGGREADYEDEPGWCRSSSAQEIADREHDLLPTSYAGAEAVEEGVAARLQVERLTRELYAKFDEAHVLERDLRRALDSL
ncbi:N-6 DNA methylase [Streptomyces sp. NPDC021225]|uniref:N-6 DNA methylase n=1 Tax=Streptomyces sp. NPDC021225 TaxID=3365121 RepID=UPI0037B189A6